MPERITRRVFLGTAAMAGAASALGVENQPQHESVTHGEVLPRRTSFDDAWMFAKGEVAGAQLPSSTGGEWSAVDLPHDWSIAGPYNKDEPGGGLVGYLPTGIAWYRKSFRLARPMAQRHVSILFDGVYQRSEVWINGHALGMRPNGYIAFSYNLTPYLHFGDEPNLIAVRVDNSLQPNSRWYSGSGIYRYVWLVSTDLTHVAQWGTTVRTSDVTADHAKVEITTRVRNESAVSAPCILKTELVDNTGKKANSNVVSQNIAAGDEYIFAQSFALVRPSLWSVATPNLYSARQSLTVQSAEVDVVTTSFGARDIRFDKDRGFLLNDARVKLNGVCLHHDGGAVGAAVPERVWERRLTLLKEMGCNAIRCSHNPPAAEFLDLCDRMGLLVMAEAFDEWREAKEQTPDFGYHKYFDEWAVRDITDMVARDRNHPSIVLWSAGNEVPDQVAPRGPETLHKLLEVLHHEDPTRLVTVGCDRIASDPVGVPPEFLSQLDVVGYNYVDRWRDRREKMYNIDRHDYPDRRFVGTESVSMRSVRGEYASDTRDPDFARYASNERIEVEQLQKFIQTYDYVSGDFFWTGIDYLGEARWPDKSASGGVIDTCGFLKDGYYFYQSLWTESPVLHLFPHWNWRGREGDIVEVACFTNCDTVELFLNGKSLGVKGFSFPRLGVVEKWNTYPSRAKVLQTTADLHLSWDVPYAPGTLKAIGAKNGETAKIVEIVTTGEPAAIRLTADRTAIETSRGDVAHITMELVDHEGRMVPTAGNEIAFAVEGPGRILGVDNGRPDSHESFQGNRRMAFNGLALVLLQSTGRTGVFHLSASSPGLTGAKISITANTV